MRATKHTYKDVKIHIRWGFTVLVKTQTSCSGLQFSLNAFTDVVLLESIIFAMQSFTFTFSGK